MHEWSIACALVKEAENEARRQGASKINSVEVVIGTLTGVVPELFMHAYDAARSGTMLEKAELKLEMNPCRGFCRQCNKSVEAGGVFPVCPNCGEGFEFEGGEGIFLRRMDIEFSGDTGEGALPKTNLAG